jgi:hypothetical protein
MGRVTICWSPLPIEHGRSFIFGPRSGRTYLLDADVADSGLIPRLLGLKRANRQAELADPAISVLPASTASGVDVGWVLPRLYRFVHRHRVIASTSRVLIVSRTVARLRAPREWTVNDIGQFIQAVEEQAGASDCYPRALITAHLCIRSRQNCSIAFGMLAPTPNLHAWCASNRVVPYEPDPPHWWYRPLAVIEITS